MKNYFLIFFSSYITILITKFIFIFYLNEQFLEFTFFELVHAIFWGVKFDFATSAVFAFLISIFDSNKKVYAFFGSIAIITIFLTQIGDIFYFDDANRHVGYEITDMIQDAQSLLMTALSQHTSMTIFAIVLSTLIFLIVYKLFKNIEKSEINKYYFLKKFFIILLTVFFVRGMFQHIPLHPWQANEIGNPDLANVSLNSIYNIVYSLANGKKKLKETKLEQIESKIKKESLKTIYKKENNEYKFPIIKTKPNLVFLFSESWSAKFMSSYGFNKKTTPKFDDLLTKSLHPKFMIANGHRTTEGIFATLSSYQNPLGESIAKTQLQNYKYSSIIFELIQEGYDSAFFQGSSKDTSGTGSLVNSLGFEKSYGKRDIKERVYEENYWGVQDTDLYNFIQKKIEKKEIKEPFVIGINGATTHDIITPEDQPKFDFVENEKLNKKLNALRYADNELGKFIKNLEEKYPNTIFIIFSDHCGGSIGGTLENYMIPFAIYSKKHIKPKKINKILSQRDIAPTIYNLVIGDKNNNTKNFTGKSIFNNKKFYADYFHNGILGWIEENDLIEINTATSKINCYKINNFTKKQIACLNTHKDMKNRAISFTSLSQELLFKGQTQNFNTYKQE